MSDNWILTYTGKKFYPLDPSVHEVDIRDIAHALSNICRFTGHCKTFYSVADHSIRVSREVSPDSALWALLHDASEAYICDIARPVKKSSEFRFYGPLEDKIMATIVTRFNLPIEMPSDIKDADDLLLRTEALDLMPACAEMVLGGPTLRQRIVPLTPAESKIHFLDRFYELVNEYRPEQPFTFKGSAVS